ncbi:uncharacterized protein LOC128746211 [Sabethes cyaneus]|uniref:uncharacterized protein LOC128746211 n=1 Tax=Sabethes cyaneus TaxID=53552 RepID=UPI00237DCF25|nr:uncharacterized protein LOC128746211 [Sabethes cyaneus]
MAKVFRVSFAIFIFTLQSSWQLDLSCVEPGCSTEEDRSILWPFEDPNFFLRCEGLPWELVRRPCLDKLLFHFERQECVDPYEWKGPCPEDLPQCPRVVCKTVYDQRKLWPHEDPSSFLQCVPGPRGGMEPLVRHCSPDTLFSWTMQQCRESALWERDCTFEDTSSTPSTTFETEPDETDPTEETTETTEENTETTEEITETTEEDTTTQSITTTTTTEPERGICPVPICSVQDPRLYPHTDWTLYYQCIPDVNGFWVPVERPCGAGTYFHYSRQLCVFMAEWEDFCL